MKSKYKVLSIVFVVAIAMAAAWNPAQSQDKVALSGLALENVKALAGVNGGSKALYEGSLGSFCCGPGDGTCGAAACPPGVGE